MLDLRWSLDVRPELWRAFGDDDARSRTRKTAVLAVLLEAGMSRPPISLDELRSMLAKAGAADLPTLETLRDLLDELQRHRLVVPYRDWDEAVSDYGEGRRRKEAWALTKEGRVTVKAVRDATLRYTESAKLPLRLLVEVAETLGRLAVHFELEPAELFGDLNALFAHLDTLQVAAGDYYEALAALNQEDVTRNEVFRLGSDRILAVLREFKRQSESSLQRIRDSLNHLRALGHEEIAERARAGIGFLADSGPQEWVRTTARRLGEIEGWLAAQGAIDGLIGSAVAGIRTLLGAIERRHHARVRGSDPAADFRMIARMVYAQPDESEANRVFAAATGIWPARHPRIGDLEGAGSASWRIKAVATLRAYESKGGARGRSQRIEDVSGLREAEAVAAAQEMARLEAVIARLATEDPVGLEHFHGLGPEQAEVLIELLEEALEAFDPESGVGVAETPFCEIRVWEPAHLKVVEVHFEEGTLRTYNMLVHVRPIAGELDGLEP